MTKNRNFFAFYGRFRELLTIVLGFHGYLQEYDSLYILESNDKKNSSVCIYGHLLPTVLGFRGDLQGP
jgi:hypothetical protein